MSLGNVSGTSGPYPPGSPKKTSSKDGSQTEEFGVSEAITRIHDPASHSTSHHFSSTEEKESQLNVEQSVNELVRRSDKGKEEAPKQSDESEKAIEEIYKRMGPALTEQHKERVRSHLEMESGIFPLPLDKHILLIKKEPKRPVEIGWVCLEALDQQEKAYFARGGFGKLYPVTFLTSPAKDRELTFKLSRKKTLTKGERKDLSQKQIVEKKAEALQNNPEGTEWGITARLDQAREYEMMIYIQKNAKDLTGLNVHAFGLVNYKNQLGFFIRRDEMDARFCFITHVPEEGTSFLFTSTIMDKFIKGVNTLHSLDIIHRDIKPENIMLRRTGNILTDSAGNECEECDVGIIDYGNAILLKDFLQFSSDGKFPTAAQLLGNFTMPFVSEKIFGQMEQAAKQINDLAQTLSPEERLENSEIEGLIAFIADRLKANDTFAAGLTLFHLWTNNTPGCEAFESGSLFKFKDADEFKVCFTSLDSCAFDSEEVEASKGPGTKIIDAVWDMIKLGI